jgi:predicted small metal-binding protein
MATTVRTFIDCREFPSESNCSLKISGTEDEVLLVAVEHAVKSHGHQRTPELREQLRGAMHEEK